MKLNLSTAIKDLRGNPVIGPDGQIALSKIMALAAKPGPLSPEELAQIKSHARDVKELTLNDILLDSLGGTIPHTEGDPGDSALKGRERLKLFELGLKVAGAEGGEIELTVEELSKIKSRVEKGYDNIVVYGQVAKLLDGSIAKPKLVPDSAPAEAEGA